MFEFKEKKDRLKLSNKMKSIPFNSNVSLQEALARKLYGKFREIESKLDNKFLLDELNSLEYSIKNNNFFEAGKVYNDLLRRFQKEGFYSLENILLDLGSMIIKFEKDIKSNIK